MKVKSDDFQMIEIYDLHIHIHSFENILEELIPLFKTKHHFFKVIDPVNRELLLNSVNHSLKRLCELVHLFEEKNKEWKKEVTLKTINKCLNKFETLTMQVTEDLVGDGKEMVKKIKEISQIN